MKFLKLLALFLLCTPWHASAYVLDLNNNALPKHWELLTPFASVNTNVVNTNTHAIRYYLASDGYSSTNTAAELNAVRASIDQWLAVSNTYIKFEEAGLVNPPVDINNNDHSNIIYWVKGTTLVNGGNDDISGALGVTYTTWSNPSHTIIEGDIVFNGYTNSTGGSNVWFTDFNNTANTNIFVEGVALHELGHLLGLGHSPAGGSTMLFRGGSGVNAQAGLSEDDIAGVRTLYPTAAATYGAVHGTVKKNGTPVLGAQVFIETAGTNLFAGTVTFPDGSYEIKMLPPGQYNLRVAPLDPFTSPRLCAGSDVAHGSYSNNNFTAADTAFQPTTSVPVTVTANVTNTVNFDVTAGAPVFRIGYLRVPSTTSGSYAIRSTPVWLTVGQSNYFCSVFSSTLPTSGATFTITGDGLTLGTPTYQASTVFVGLNGISMSVSVASNATPGLRSLIVEQGGNIAYANGFFEIKPAVPDYNFDGLDDRFQRQYFAPWTTALAMPDADPDGDGMNNTAEYIAGTSPTNALSLLKLQQIDRTNSTATIRWDSVAGKKYQVSYRTNIATGSWSNLGSTVTASGITSSQTDPAATNENRFYRVQVLP
jgi:hypothetical protein